jgi:hypothetical protein
VTFGALVGAIGTNPDFDGVAPDFEISGAPTDTSPAELFAVVFVSVPSRIVLMSANMTF